MFYFWHVDDLVHDLRAGIVTEYEKMRYFLWTVVLHSAQGLSFMKDISPAEKSLISVFVLIGLFILIWGIYHCYRMNKQFGDNKNFIERFVCLSFPLGIKIGVLSALLFIAVLALVAIIIALIFSIKYAPPADSLKDLYFAFAKSPIKLMFEALANIYFAAVSIYFYHILGKKIVEVSNPNNIQKGLRSDKAL